MRTVAALSMTAVLVLGAPADARAQAQTPASAAVSVPRLITITGTYQPASGQPAPASAVITLAVYAEPTDGAPLFQETQDVALDPNGRYVVQLGATQPDGLPLALFADTQERWLGVQFAGPGETEHPRTRLTSVPYALRAADADTLGGHPASAYVLSPKGAKGDAATTDTANGSATTNGVQTGTLNMLAKYVNTTDVGDSGVFENNGLVGIGTTGPIDALHVRFANTTGTMTGYAVQNLGNTTTSYSGMLFYDQNNALGQFQGFNNVTHEYRINNVAKNGASQFDGSINFMIGGTSRFLVAPNGSIGINTTAPNGLLDVSNATSASVFSNILSTSYTGSTQFGSVFNGRKARGTSAAPTAVLAGDSLASFIGRGFGATTFGPGSGGMVVRAAENYTDTAQGTSLNFNTTPLGANAALTQVTITPSGDVGIGTTNPVGSLEVWRNTGGDASVVATSFGGSGAFFGQAARGTFAAPAAVQAGDPLAILGGNGYGSTQFGNVNGIVGIAAAETWTDTAHGTAVGFLTTPLGSTDMAVQVAVLPNGNVGIGTPADVNGIPTATDKLQIFGDVRVGTSGTNGCVKNFAGTQLTGTCVSDRRYKRGITPFGAALDRVAALQPVHFYWRADEFPDQHFGNTQAYGLIAQDVERVLPELVVTHEDGYKAVDYSALPLLTIQALKELKAENDDLKKRVAELERLITAMHTTGGDR